MIDSSTIQRINFFFISLFLLISIGIFLTNPFYEGDTLALLEGVSAIRRCLSKGVFFQCPNVVHFPVFQYIPSLVCSEFGFSRQTILKILSLLSTVSFFASLFVVYYVMKKVAKTSIGMIAVLIMISSPLFHYARSSLNEMVAVFITLSFTSSVILRANTWVITTLTFLAGITKETAVPFLIFIGVLALYPEILRYPSQLKTQIIGIVTGVIFSIILNVAFNYFRFGTIYNMTLLQDIFIVKSTSQRLSSFLGIWLSPNGGIIFFWFSFSVYLFLIFSKILKSLSQGIGRDIRNIPALVIILILVALTFGFASWWAPFGWWSWGPRLMLPWLPSLLILTLYFYQQETLSALKKLLFTNKWSIWLSTLILFLMSLPNLAALLFPGIWISLFNPDSTCPRTPYITEPGYYYYCLNHLMWTKLPPLPLQANLTLLSNNLGCIYGATYLFALFSLICLIRSSMSKENQLINK